MVNKGETHEIVPQGALIHPLLFNPSLSCIGVYVRTYVRTHTHDFGDEALPSSGIIPLLLSL